MNCEKHPNWPAETCVWCTGHKDNIKINTGEWVSGWYEHIDRNPIYIHSKSHLAHECEKRGLLARALMKPKSQGKGYEHKT